MISIDEIISGKLESNDIVWDLDNETISGKTPTGNKMVKAFAEALLGRKINQSKNEGENT